MAELTKACPWHSLCWVSFQVECRNYIRTLHKVNETTMYVCGTNAFSPTCDYMVSMAGAGLGYFTSWSCIRHFAVSNANRTIFPDAYVYFRPFTIVWLHKMVYLSLICPLCSVFRICVAVRHLLTGS